MGENIFKEQSQSYYCEVCDKIIHKEQTHVMQKPEEYNVKGIPIKILAQVVTCNACGNELLDDYFDTSNMLRAYSIYNANCENEEDLIK